MATSRQRKHHTTFSAAGTCGCLTIALLLASTAAADAIPMLPPLSEKRPGTWGWGLNENARFAPGGGGSRPWAARAPLSAGSRRHRASRLYRATPSPSMTLPPAPAPARAMLCAQRQEEAAIVFLSSKFVCSLFAAASPIGGRKQIVGARPKNPCLVSSTPNDELDLRNGGGCRARNAGCQGLTVRQPYCGTVGTCQTSQLTSYGQPE